MNTFDMNIDIEMLMRKLLKEITKRVNSLNYGENVKIYSRKIRNKTGYIIYFAVTENISDIEQIYYICNEYKEIYESEYLNFIVLDMR